MPAPRPSVHPVPPPPPPPPAASPAADGLAADGLAFDRLAAAGLGPDGLTGLRRPPAPGGLRLPPWADDLRTRVGLDRRAVVWVVVALFAAGAALWLLRPASAPVEEALPMAASSSPSASSSASSSTGGAAPASTTSSTTVPADVVVHAAGAVARPGVYPLPGGARVDDLLRAAGGPAPDADVGRLNLAAPLADGARVYVPHVGEGEPPAVVGLDGAPPASASSGSADRSDPDEGAEPTAPIDLNTATEDELDALPGVGPSIAAAIVAFRDENGGFASVDDLLDVRGIGEARLAEIRPLVKV